MRPGCARRRYTAALLLIATTIPPVIAEAQGLSLSVATNWAVLSNGSSSSGGSGKGDEVGAVVGLGGAQQRQQQKGRGGWEWVR